MSLYVDTFDSLWNERDLTDYATALALAEDYLTALEQRIPAMRAC